MANIGVHAGGLLGASGFSSWLTNFLRNRKEEIEREKRNAAETALAVTISQLTGKIEQLIADMKDHKAAFEDVVTTKNAVRALGDKFDDYKNIIKDIGQRVSLLESKRRK